MDPLNKIWSFLQSISIEEGRWMGWALLLALVMPFVVRIPHAIGLTLHWVLYRPLRWVARLVRAIGPAPAGASAAAGAPTPAAVVAPAPPAPVPPPPPRSRAPVDWDKAWQRIGWVLVAALVVVGIVWSIDNLTAEEWTAVKNWLFGGIIALGLAVLLSLMGKGSRKTAQFALVVGLMLFAIPIAAALFYGPSELRHPNYIGSYTAPVDTWSTSYRNIPGTCVVWDRFDVYARTDGHVHRPGESRTGYVLQFRSRGDKPVEVRLYRYPYGRCPETAPVAPPTPRKNEPRVPPIKKVPKDVIEF